MRWWEWFVVNVNIGKLFELPLFREKLQKIVELGLVKINFRREIFISCVVVNLLIDFVRICFWGRAFHEVRDKFTL